MKNIYLILFLMFVGFTSFAQLPDGSTAPDWTLTDLNGNTENLYDVLDAGYPVVIDFSTTWCGPCWSYHQTHTLDHLNEEYGPNGTVEQDKIRVYYIESDDATNEACLYGPSGCNNSTHGDWVTGTSFQIFSPLNESVRISYGVSSYPTLIAICPNKKLYDVGQASKSTWVSWLMETCALDQNFFVTDELCNGDESGAIDLSVSGGAGNVTYLWNNGETSEDLSDLAAGTYSCTIKEGRGHTIETGDIIVTGPATPVEIGSSEITDIFCNGDDNGMVSITATGGAGGHTFLWNTGETSAIITDLAPGDYTVVVTDVDGCEAEATYTVDEPEQLSQNTNVIPETCESSNGTIVIQASGGTSPFVFSIGTDNNNSGIFPNLPGGAYSISVVDANGCSVSSAVAVTSLPSPDAAASSSEAIDCYNIEVEISGDGSSTGPFIIYNWSTANGHIVSGGNTLYPIIDAPGTYEIMVTDAQSNCTETASVTVTANIAAPVSDAGNGQIIDCINVTAILDGSNSTSGSNITYLWETTNGNIVEGGDTDAPTVNAAGDYELIVTNTDNGCSSSSIVTVEQSAEVPESNAGAEQALTCVASEVVLDGSASTDGPNIVYTWTTEDGEIVSGENTATPTVNAAGTYLLEVLNETNGCTALSSVTVIINMEEPVASIEEAEMLTCVLVEQTLTLDLDDDLAEIVWTTVDGNIVSGGDTDQPLIDAPGEYVAMIIGSDNGCATTVSIVVEEFINTPEAAYAFSNEDKVFSFVNSSEGTPTSYLWNFGDGNTSNDENPIHEYADNGDYEVCLTINNECGENTSCSTITVSSGSSLLYTENLTNVTCNGVCNGAIEIIPADIIENYTIDVSGPSGFEGSTFLLDGLCPGDYTFTITNEIGESADGDFVIEEPTEIVINASDIIQIDCNGNETGSILVDVNGGTGDLAVSWDNGVVGMLIENLPAGVYTATVLDENGCEVIQSFEIVEPDLLALESSSITHIDDTHPTGAIDISIEGGVPGYGYLWSHGATTEDVDGLDLGNYTVIVTDLNGCSKEFGPFEVESIVAIYEIDALDQWSILPNPTQGYVNIQLDFSVQSEANISILNNLGQEMISKTVSGTLINERQDLSNFVSGLYFVKITVDNKTSLKKLIIE